MACSVLVVEDDETLGDNIRMYLERAGWDVQLADSAESALRLIDSMRPDVLLTDFNLPGKNGIELMQSALTADPQVKVILMTGEGSVQTAVDAMKGGAYDYVTKPVVLAELRVLIEKAQGITRMERTLSVYQRKQAREAGLDAMIGSSPAILDVKQRIRQILDAEARMTEGDPPAVLITGETGTGKELVARSLHFDGLRAKGPFVEVNCASIPSNLLEAELFGHEKGAFTDAKDRKIGLVEAADGGTLFLDEIGEVDLSIQAKLLKLLEERSMRRVGSVRERKVNIRIISATNQDLERMVREGRFRSDLFFRLRILTVRIPPLRARGDDVLTLARHFLDGHARRYGKPGLVFSPESEQVLKGYGWPGNIREMRNMLEQTVLLARDREITPEDLTICPGLSPGASVGQAQPIEAFAAPVSAAGTRISDVERDLVVKTLEKTDWNVSKSAKLLGLSRDMLRYRIEKYGLARPDE